MWQAKALKYDLSGLAIGVPGDTKPDIFNLQTGPPTNIPRFSLWTNAVTVLVVGAVAAPALNGKGR